jgi:hypothetical protein
MELPGCVCLAWNCRDISRSAAAVRFRGRSQRLNGIIPSVYRHPSENLKHIELRFARSLKFETRVFFTHLTRPFAGLRIPPPAALMKDTDWIAECELFQSRARGFPSRAVDLPQRRWTFAAPGTFLYLCGCKQ